MPPLTPERTRELHQRWSRELFRYLRRPRLPRAVSEELVQDVFVKAMELDEFPAPAGEARALLFTLAHRRYVDLVRRSVVAANAAAGPLRPGPDGPGPDGPGGAPGEWLEIEQILALVEAKDARWGEALRLQIVHGCTTAEIAGIMGHPEPTVRAWLSKARAWLREHLRGPERKGAVMDEVEGARAEFRELTGLDPASHRGIEAEYDVARGLERLEATMAPPPTGSWAAKALGGGAAVAVLLLGGWLLTRPPSVADEAPRPVVGGASAPAEPSTPAPIPTSPSATAAPVTTRPPAPSAPPTAPPPAAPSPASHASDAAPNATAADPVVTGSALEAPPEAEPAHSPEPAPEGDTSGPGSILPERQAWQAARAALEDARGAGAPAAYAPAAAAYDAYLATPTWHTFRAAAELDRAEVALGAHDWLDASRRLRALLTPPRDAEARAKLVGMLVLAESGAGRCDALSAVPDGEGGSAPLAAPHLARCRRPTPERP